MHSFWYCVTYYLIRPTVKTPVISNSRPNHSDLLLPRLHLRSGLGIGKPDVLDEESGKQAHDSHADCDDNDDALETTGLAKRLGAKGGATHLRLVLGSGKGNALDGSGSVGLDEADGVLVGRSGEGQVAHVLIEPLRNEVGPDS